MVFFLKKFNTRTIVILSVFLAIFITIAHILMIHFGTEIGKEGYRDTFIKNIFFIVEGFLILIISLMAFRNFNLNLKSLIVCMVVSLMFIIFGIINSYILLTESQDDLITEKITVIRIERAGYHNQDIKIEGVVNEEKRYFILRGRDKKMVKNIKESVDNNIVIVYHPSNQRIESISFH